MEEGVSGAGHPGESEGIEEGRNTGGKSLWRPAEAGGERPSGYRHEDLIRAHADEGAVAARTKDTSRRDALLRSGPQMISTDYPLFEPSKWTGYSVGFANGLPARCNIVNAPAGCRNDLLEPGAESGGTPSPEYHPATVQSTR